MIPDFSTFVYTYQCHDELKYQDVKLITVTKGLYFCNNKGRGMWEIWEWNMLERKQRPRGKSLYLQICITENKKNNQSINKHTVWAHHTIPSASNSPEQIQSGNHHLPLPRQWLIGSRSHGHRSSVVVISLFRKEPTSSVGNESLGYVIFLSHIILKIVKIKYLLTQEKNSQLLNQNLKASAQIHKTKFKALWFLWNWTDTKKGY